MKLSVVLATYNEEKNLRDCLESIKSIADEIIIVDGNSTDKTVEIANLYDAKVIITQNHPIFHINKQKALELAKNDWVLQLDADERVSSALANEIKAVINMTESDKENHQQTLTKNELFARHQKLLQERDGSIGTDNGDFSAYFIPRLNYFLGRYLRYGGVYPDGVIRLVRKEKTHFPCKSVHEQIEVEGRVGWLGSDLLHFDSPTFDRYKVRNSRYIDLTVSELQKIQQKKNVSSAAAYFVVKPLSWFLMTYIRHKGFLDSWQGLVFSLFSALRFPRAYSRYLKK